MNKLILASGSPRRREMLAALGYEFDVFTANFDESSVSLAQPAEGVKQLALGKAEAARAAFNGTAENTVFLGADTIVALDDVCLGKPSSEAEAHEMLRSLSGKTHSVFTGVALVSDEKSEVFVSETKVAFYDISDEEIDAYIASGEPMDKAGSYGIQGLGGVFVKGISGDYQTVVGLPLSETYRMLKKYGISPISF